MSTEVKNIIVALKARMDGAFKRTMDAGAAAVGGLRSKVAMAAKGAAIAGAAVAAAGAAAAAAVAGMVVHVAGGMDVTGKLADRLGMTTQALAGLQHAAKLADVADLGGALEGWNKRLGQAVAGTGTAADALKILGLKARDLAVLPMDAQILKLSDALAKVTNPAERAALSAGLFGRAAGAEMSTMLGEGSGAIRASMAEAERLGLTYDRATAGIAESFNDNMTRVRGAIVGMATQATAALLPWFEGMSTKAVAWATEIMPSVQAAITGAFQYITQIVSIFGSVFASVFDAGRSILEGFGVSFQGTGDFFSRVADGIISAIRWLAAGIIKAVTFIESVFVNWRDSLEIVWKGALLGGVVFYETLKHWFTVSLPAYLQWFGRNWRALFTDIWNATKTIVGNMWKNLSGFFAAVWGWLKGEGWDFTWTGLLEGFKSTVEALPQIAARTRTALEESLSADITAAADRIGTYYQEKITERLGKLDAGKRAADTAAEAAKKAAAAAAAGAARATRAAAELVTGPAEPKVGARPAEFGVLGQIMRITGLVAAALGPAPDEPERKTASNTGKMVTVLERLDRRAADSKVGLVFSDGMD